MTAGDEIIMPVHKAEALQHAEITVLRQIGDNLTAQTRALEALRGKVDDVRERVIRLEEQKVAKEVETLKQDLAAALERIDELESQRDRAVGAASLWGWMAKNAPWLFAGLAAFAAGAGIKGWPFK